MEFKNYKTNKKEIKDYLMEKYFTETPEGTDEVVHISDIIVSPNFKSTKRRMDQNKIKRAISYYVKNHMLDKPITVIMETNEKGFHNKYILVDEYSRYVACDEYMGINYVPVRYIDVDTYCEEKRI